MAGLGGRSIGGWPIVPLPGLSMWGGGKFSVVSFQLSLRQCRWPRRAGTGTRVRQENGAIGRELSSSFNSGSGPSRRSGLGVDVQGQRRDRTRVRQWATWTLLLIRVNPRQPWFIGLGARPARGLEVLPEKSSRPGRPTPGERDFRRDLVVFILSHNRPGPHDRLCGSVLLAGRGIRVGRVRSSRRSGRRADDGRAAGNCVAANI
jgi:hypothetical protein